MEPNLSTSQCSDEYVAALVRLLAQTSNPKLGLLRIKELLERMDLKANQSKVVQVVGTNGKGSTVAFLRALVEGQNLLVGTFISPHLSSARERIAINGELISENDFVWAAEAVLKQAKSMPDEPSFFECMLAMAMWHFKKSGVDTIILEAGLGGRLDATTAVEADILGISSIDLDHQNILGNSIDAIAKEKILAARLGQQVILSANQHEEVLKVVQSLEKEQGFLWEIAKSCDLPLSLKGPHQKLNAGLAIALFNKLYPRASEQSIQKALLRASWPGRFEVFNSFSSPIILDGAHNEAGIHTLIASLLSHEEYKKAPTSLILAATSGHNTKGMVEALFGANIDIRYIYLYSSRNLRALSKEQLAQVLIESGINSDKMSPFISLDDCLRRGHQLLVCGSLYAVGEIRCQITDMPIDPSMPNF